MPKERRGPVPCTVVRLGGAKDSRHVFRASVAGGNLLVCIRTWVCLRPLHRHTLYSLRTIRSRIFYRFQHLTTAYFCSCPSPAIAIPAALYRGRAFKTPLQTVECPRGLPSKQAAITHFCARRVHLVFRAGSTWPRVWVGCRAGGSDCEFFLLFSAVPRTY